MNYQEAIAKATKLLRLSASSNPHEAAQAAARAQEIIDRFKIEAIALNMDGGADAQPDEPIQDFGSDLLDAGRPVDTWRWRLFHHVAEANGCKGYIRPGQGMAIVGRPSDATTVRYIYAWLRQEVERLRARDCQGFSHVYQNNYRNGVVDTVGQRLHAQAEETRNQARRDALLLSQQAGQSLALVRVDKALAKLDAQKKEVEGWMKAKLKLRSGGARGGRHDSDARHRGQQAGHDVRFTKARGSVGGGQ